MNSFISNFCNFLLNYSANNVHTKIKTNEFNNLITSIKNDQDYYNKTLEDINDIKNMIFNLDAKIDHFISDSRAKEDLGSHIFTNFIYPLFRFNHEYKESNLILDFIRNKNQQYIEYNILYILDEYICSKKVYDYIKYNFPEIYEKMLSVFLSSNFASLKDIQDWNKKYDHVNFYYKDYINVLQNHKISSMIIRQIYTHIKVISEDFSKKPPTILIDNILYQIILNKNTPKDIVNEISNCKFIDYEIKFVLISNDKTDIKDLISIITMAETLSKVSPAPYTMYHYIFMNKNIPDEIFFKWVNKFKNENYPHWNQLLGYELLANHPKLKLEQLWEIERLYPELRPKLAQNPNYQSQLSTLIENIKSSD